MVPFVRSKSQKVITVELAREIWTAYNIQKQSRREIAARFGISTSTVDGIVSGRKHMDATLELRREYLAKRAD